MTTETTKTGRLTGPVSYGVGSFREEYHSCVDCGTSYPVLGEYDENFNFVTDIKCNGHTIAVCPWCRPDSEPWKNGRGT